MNWSWAGRSARRCSALLALRTNQAVARSELIDGIWGEDPPPSAVNALHVHVAGLRRALEPNRASRAPGQFLQASGPGYSLRLEPGQLDAQVLARHLDAARGRGRRATWVPRRVPLTSALRLWQAAPLSGVPGPWAEIERVRLSEVRLTAIEERAEIMLMLGRAAAAAAELTGLVREHPLREALRGQLDAGAVPVRAAGGRAGHLRRRPPVSWSRSLAWNLAPGCSGCTSRSWPLTPLWVRLPPP